MAEGMVVGGQGSAKRRLGATSVTTCPFPPPPIDDDDLLLTLSGFLP